MLIVNGMSLTASSMLPLGTKAPAFTLKDASRKSHALSFDGRAPATLVIFMCNHCPYVIHLKQHLSDFCKAYSAKGVQIFAINSNDPDYRKEDGPETMLADAKQYAYPFPYVIDEAQDVARAYNAACTPDFFLFDHGMKLVYRGQFDSSRPGNGKPITGENLGAAIDAVLAGKPVSQKQLPSMGCSIKWK
jgi:peroxiredoxin